jgi:hypothetical protein
MAVITPERVNPYGVDLEIWKWVGMAAGDTALPVNCTYKQDKSVYFLAATPGTAVFTMQGTPDPLMAAATFAILEAVRTGATPITALVLATTMSCVQILTSCTGIKPVLTGGATTAGADIWLHIRGR